MATPERAQLRELLPQDHAAVMALFQRHGWPVRSRAGWAWALFDSPARRDLKAAPGWVLESAGQVVGFLGNLPMRYHRQGQAVWGATCTSYLVDEAHRRCSTSLLRAFATQKGVGFVHSATANEYSAPIYRLFKFAPSADPLTNQRLRWVANDSALIQHGLAALGVPGLALVGTITGPLLRLARQASGLAAAPRARSGFSAHAVTAGQMGHSWDTWAQQLHAASPLCVDRSAQTLSWRLTDPDGSSDMALFALVGPDGQQRGMAQLRVLPRNTGQTPKAELMDWALLPGTDHAAAATLLQACLGWAESRRAAVLDAKRCTGEAAACLQALGPRVGMLPPEAVWTLERKAPDAALELPLQHWGMTGADSDDWFSTHRTALPAEARRGFQAVSSAAQSSALS